MAAITETICRVVFSNFTSLKEDCNGSQFGGIIFKK